MIYQERPSTEALRSILDPSLALALKQADILRRSIVDTDIVFSDFRCPRNEETARQQAYHVCDGANGYRTYQSDSVDVNVAKKERVNEKGPPNAPFGCIDRRGSSANAFENSTPPVMCLEPSPVVLGTQHGASMRVPNDSFNTDPTNVYFICPSKRVSNTSFNTNDSRSHASSVGDETSSSVCTPFPEEDSSGLSSYNALARFNFPSRVEHEGTLQEDGEDGQSTLFESDMFKSFALPSRWQKRGSKVPFRT